MKTILGAALMLLSTLAQAQTPSFSRGGESGGGGDPTEARVDEIRGDILSWIKLGGSKGLVLPEGVTLSQYNESMTSILQPKAVVVTFLSKDDPTDPELQVVVDGKPKTCRGFISRHTNVPNIICNIQRFKEITPSEEYRLIHHEFAGLMKLERNEGAASDYFISNQLSDYLESVKVLKLAVKKPAPALGTPGCEIKLSRSLRMKELTQYSINTFAKKGYILVENRKPHTFILEYDHYYNGLEFVGKITVLHMLSGMKKSTEYELGRRGNPDPKRKVMEEEHLNARNVQEYEQIKLKWAGYKFNDASTLNSGEVAISKMAPCESFFK